MMKDINGVEMKTGDIVRVKDAYFKNDNGIYFVDHTPGDASWCGSEYSLKKMCNNGKLSTATHNIAFWPLSAFTNNRLKNAECKEWNKEHATIEIIYNIDNSKVIEHFKEEAETMKKQVEYQARYYGENSQVAITSKEIYTHYLEVAARMEAKEETGEHAEDQKINTMCENCACLGDTCQGSTNQTWTGCIYKTNVQPSRSAEIKETVKADELPAETKLVEEVTEEAIELKAVEAIEEPQPEVLEVVRKYYPINEQLAKTSKSLWSFNDYAMNSETNSYKNQVEKAYILVDKIAKLKPARLSEAELLADRFAKSYAEWINKGFSIEMRCPSVMICGAGNFPTRRKEKQNTARDQHMQKLDYINGYIKKLENILHGKEIIKSGDSDAIEKLQVKLTELEESQKFMKDLNSYYRKNNTCKGFQDFTEEKAQKYDDSISKDWRNTPFPSYALTNNNAKIKATKERLEQLQKAKAEPIKEVEQSDICKVVENTEIMRIQLIFDGKPDEKTRTILKSNGFKWAPSQGAWQRQLTDNARYSTKKALEQLKAM